MVNLTNSMDSLNNRSAMTTIIFNILVKCIHCISIIIKKFNNEIFIYLFFIKILINKMIETHYLLDCNIVDTSKT